MKKIRALTKGRVTPRLRLSLETYEWLSARVFIDGCEFRGVKSITYSEAKRAHSPPR